MPTNVTPEYAKAHERYLDARTKREKIEALEEMIRTCPKHKGTEHLLAELKSKLAKLRKQSEGKKARHITTIPKEGDAQITIIGLTQSGKSSLLTKLTNAKPKISSHPYTTTKPEIGMAEWKGVKLQLVEIPSTFQRIHMNIAQNCNGVITVLDSRKNLGEQRKEIKNILEKFRINKPMIEARLEDDSEEIKKNIWERLNLIRTYTKEPGRKPEERALVLKNGGTVRDAAKDVHKDFLEFFKFARIWGKSVVHQGQSVGLEHKLKDGDIIEIHIS